MEIFVFVWNWIKNMAVLFSLLTWFCLAHFIVPTLEKVAADIKVIRATCTQQLLPEDAE